MEENRRGGPCARPVDNKQGGRPQGAPLPLFFADIKFEHSIFALPFAYLGLFLAEGGWPRFNLFFWVTVAMVFFRTFSMAANRLIDREIDRKNPRTLPRALPQKLLSQRFVQGVGLGSLLIFLTSAAMLSSLCFFLTPIPILLAWLYPYLKRFTWLSHSVLGIILGISPYGAWLASRSDFSWVPGLLFIGVASWVTGFDILYSLQDLDFDREQGLYSVPVLWGKDGALKMAAGLHLIAFFGWAGAGILSGLGWIYGAGLLIAGVFLIREHQLLHRFGLAKIDQAFFSMNAWTSVIVFLAAFVDLSWV